LERKFEPETACQWLFAGSCFFRQYSLALIPSSHVDSYQIINKKAITN